MAYNIGIVGATRRRQGTGPYVARTFAQLGHHIAGVIGSSEKTTSESVTNLQASYGITTKGYSSLSALIEQNAVDALAICSPADTHLQYLQAGLANNLHIFCEKPLWWPVSSLAELSCERYLQQIDELLELAQHKQRFLHLNTQWPYTLADFFRLYPQAKNEFSKIKQFSMHLSPQSKGLQMVIDSASHTLSMLYQLLGAGEIRAIQDIIDSKAQGEKRTLSFQYLHSRGTTATSLCLTHTPTNPKPAWYEINGFKVERTIKLPEYHIQLQSTNRMVTIIDPLESSIRDFIACIQAENRSDEVALRLGAQHLCTLAKACQK